MAFTPAPPTPDRADKLTFPSRMYNWFVWFVATIAELSNLGSAYNLATSTTSSTSNTIGTGSKTFTVPAGLGFIAGMPLNIANTATPTNSFFGYVTSYSSTTLIVNVTSTLGSGTFSAWSISLAASAGGATLGSNIFTALQRWTTGSNIASAATVDLTAATGNTVNITGTTTTTAFTITAGQWMELIAPAGWPLTFHATNLNIAGGQSYLCRAGDRVKVYKALDGVTYVNIFSQNGNPVLNNYPVPVRQTVLAAPVDTSGLPSFLPATSASLVLTTQNVTGTAPLVITSSNGSSDLGDLNRIGQAITNALSWTVGASVTSYLPVTVNADGTLTAVTPVTLAPIYQFGGTPSVTNNQYTYNIQEGKMYKGNGASASQVNDVIVGEVVSGATTITSTIAYAVRGKYDSGFTATLPGVSTKTSKNHNIGVIDIDCDFIIECTTADGNYAVGEQLDHASLTTGSSTTSIAIPLGRSRLAEWITTGTTTAFFTTNETTGASFLPTAGSWKYKFTAKRRW